MEPSLGLLPLKRSFYFVDTRYIFFMAAILKLMDDITYIEVPMNPMISSYIPAMSPSRSIIWYVTRRFIVPCWSSMKVFSNRSVGCLMDLKPLSSLMLPMSWYSQSKDSCPSCMNESSVYTKFNWILNCVPTTYSGSSICWFRKVSTLLAGLGSSWMLKSCL